METVKLAFEEFGSPDNSPLIILHGFFASSRNWRQVALKLSARFHVFVPDQRNHGMSPHHCLLNYPAMTADLLRFMDACDLDVAHLLGHSMGGKVAMWFALSAPHRVEKLIVADIAPVSYAHNFDSTILALKALPLTQISNRKHAEMLLAPSVPELGYRQFLLQNLILKDGNYCWRVDLDIFHRTSHYIAAFPSTDHFSAYAGAALFVAGGYSDYVKPEAISSLFPKAAISTIDGAGHWLHVQQPDIFTAQVERFLV